MNPERWESAKRLFHDALERPSAERDRFVRDATAGDTELRDEVIGLLAAQTRADEAFRDVGRSGVAQVLLPGTRLGAYEIHHLIGVGGMGEVYQARDTKLRRDVAVKVLPMTIAGDADRLHRFEREAQVLASLNHPHIAAIYGFEESAGIAALVLELVEGPTLADRIAQGPVPVNEALAIARQIADALEAAHERGIIHRDLKPANVKLTPDGTVKVLDFGLAKVEASAGNLAQSPTISAIVTREGVIAGTAPYMSPEQARAKPVDKRADIWAFGCVLFEMLANRRPFDGPSVSDIFVAILERDPDWSLLPSNTPPPVHRLLRRCLEKDARRRLRDAGDTRLELDDALASTGAAGDRDAHVAPHRGTAWRSAAMLAVAAAAGAIVAAALLRSDAPPPAPEVRFNITLPAGERLAETDFPALAISPDGKLVTYITARGGSTQLVLRRLDTTEAAPVAGTANAISPFFSPDSRWIAFFADGDLKKVPVAGGPAITICEADIGFGGSWGSDDTIVFAPATGSALSRVHAGGGTPSRATRLDAERGEFSHRWPELLPASKTVLFTVGTVGEWDEAEIVAQSLDGGRREIVLKGGTHPHYLESGHLLYTHAGAVWRAPFDADRLVLTGPATRALEGVSASVDGAAQFSVSRSGHAVYLTTAETAGHRLLVVEGSDVTPLAAPARAYTSPRLSADGKRLVVGIADDAEHIWTYDLAAGTLKQLTYDAANRAPIWTPDGQRVTFSSNRSGALNLFIAAADGSGAPERLTTSEYLQLPGSWSPDGGTLAFVEQHPSTGRDIWLLRGVTSRTAFANSMFDESAPRFSPDGRWIAYVSNKSGRADVFVRASNGAGDDRQVSTGGGMEPVWARDGRALFYRAEKRLMTVSVSDSVAMRTGAARVVFEGRVESGAFDAANYDVMPGAGKFVMIASASPETGVSEFRVVLNWRHEDTK